MKRGKIKDLLAPSETRGLGLDDPATPFLRREILKKNGFLRAVYAHWYARMRQALPPGPGAVVELGSGAGFFGEAVPGGLTSEVFFAPHVDLAADAQELPFRDRALKAICLTDTFHHLPRAGRFLAEAARCVRPGGAILMVEPWVTPWSRLVFGALHHEPFAPRNPAWEFPAAGPLSSANQALAWIVFHRDRKRFESEFPQWGIGEVGPFMPFAYLISGGFTLRGILPGSLYPLTSRLERMLAPFYGAIAMFAFIRLDRQDVAPG